MDKLAINGWAFCETEEDNEDRRTTLLLKGDEACYELIPFAITRLDVPIQVPVDLNRPDMKITPLSGYIGQFSLIGIEDGIYDIYLCCWENETNHGIADTLYQLVRDGDHTDVIPWSTSALEHSIVATQNEKTFGYLDSVRLQDSKITIRGWEFVYDRESADQTLYVEITNPEENAAQYPTKSLTRTDVANFYSDERYAQSGYVTKFPEEELKNGLSTVLVYIENSGEVCRSKQFSIYRDEDQISVFQSKINLAPAMGKPITATVNEQSMGYLDPVNINGGFVTFSGWEFAPDKESSDSSIVIELTGSDGVKRQYQTSTMRRNDVAEIYHDQRYAQSGYTMTILAEDFPDGIYTVRVYTVNDEEVWQSKQYTVVRTGEGTTVKQS